MSFESLLDKIENKKAVVGIVGLGYVGLPLMQAFVGAGFRVIGFDVDKKKVDQLLAGQSYIRHLSAENIQSCIRSGKFTPTIDFKQLAQVHAVCICVPTPLTVAKDPDLSYVCRTAESISAHLQLGQLIVLESTTYPGTTKEIVQPILERSGRSLDKGEFFLAYSPEREDPGRKDFSTTSIPKIVGGSNEESLLLANALYSSIVTETVPVPSCEIAEAAKILENIYRSVNIAMVNELKMMFDKMNLDVWEVIAAAKTKPFGFHAFYPGPGLGGHCIPIDPFYLSWKARQVDMPTRFIELAGEINSSMPEWVIHKLGLALNTRKKAINGSRILVLGVAYKKDVDDFRESPAFRLIEILQDRGAEVCYHDPYVPHFESEKKLSPIRMDSVDLTDDRIRGADVVLIVTDHSSINYTYMVDTAQLVVDTRNVTRGCPDPEQKIFKA